MTKHTPGDWRAEAVSDAVRREGMKITIENTTKMVTLNGVAARIWEGR